MADNSDSRKKDYVTIDEYISIVSNIAVAVACFAFVLPVFFKNIHIGYQYILVCVGLMILSLLTVFLNAKQSRPAVKILPKLAFFDILIYATLFIANIIRINEITTFKDFFDLLHLYDILEESGIVSICVISAIGFVLLSLFSFANKYSDSFVSVVVIIEGVALSLFSGWRFSINHAYGRSVFAVSIIVTLIWLFICTYSNAVLKGERRCTAFYSLVISITVILFNFFFANNSTEGMNIFFVIPEMISDPIARKMYPWWLAILLTVLFFIVGTILAFLADDCSEDDVRAYADAKFFYSVASLAFLTKIILSNYFSYSIILYVCVLVILNADIRKDTSRIEKKERVDRYYDYEDFIIRSLRLFYIVICFIFVVQIAENMLYLTLPVALIIMYMLYKLLNNCIKKYFFDDDDIKSVLDGLPKSYQSTIVVLTSVFTASLIYHYRFSRSNFTVLSVLAVTVILVFAALKRKLPNNIVLREMNTVKWLAAIFVVIFCVVLTASSGAKLKMEYDMDNPSTTISISSNEKSTISTIVYGWDNGIVYDAYQMFVGDEYQLNIDKEIQDIDDEKNNIELVLPIQGEKLTVSIIDSNGVQTTRVLWFPIWFDRTF